MAMGQEIYFGLKFQISTDYYSWWSFGSMIKWLSTAPTTAESTPPKAHLWALKVKKENGD